MSSQYEDRIQMANLLRSVADLQDALASRVEEVAVLQQEVATAVEQRDTLALFLAPRRYLLEEDSHDLARDCLAIVEEFLGPLSSAPSTPAPPALSHHPAADAAIVRGSFGNRDAPSHLHHHQAQHYQTPPPRTALSPSPTPYRAASPPAIAATATATTTTTVAAAAAHGPASPPSAPVSLASSPGPATPTPPRAQNLAATNTAAATAGTTASERAAGSAELRRLGAMARSMEEGDEEAEMRDRGSPVPRNRAERNWVRVGGVGRGGVWDGGVDVRALPPPRIVWPGQ
ncbi:hypothetical protein MMC27_001847 [Xylographa pallens]|nr:hypothetical protein [Xylographa pallens]